MINDDVLKMAIAISRRIEVLELSTMTYNALRRWGVDSVADLCDVRENGKLQNVRGIGRKALNEIEHALDEYLNAYATEG